MGPESDITCLTRTEEGPLDLLINWIVAGSTVSRQRATHWNNFALNIWENHGLPGQ